MRRPALLLALAAAAAAPGLHAQPATPNPAVERIRAQYAKSEHHVRMRDGVELYVAVYSPRDASPSKPYPILLNRTPYACGPYGPDAVRTRIAPSQTMQDEGYIFVCNDVRGRYMSDGAYDNMRPHVPHGRGISESSDTYDVIDWLVRNVPNNTGKVGQWGISYPGFYTSAALPEAHPALVASSPQAPIADMWHDDFLHNGRFLMGYFQAFPVFGVQKTARTGQGWYEMLRPGTRDGYAHYLREGYPQAAVRGVYKDNFFFQEIAAHPTYDAYWQARNLLPHLKNVRHAVLTVGGLFDAEDLYGAWQTYAAVERQSPNAAFNGIVMGPWSHGQWASPEVRQALGDAIWGDSLSLRYQRDVEAPFFRRYLKGSTDAPPAEATVYDTGAGTWVRFNEWPVRQGRMERFYLRADRRLATTAPTAREAGSLT